MTTPQKRRSRYDLSDAPGATPAPAAPTPVPVMSGPWEGSGEVDEARRMLEAARADVERVVLGEMRRLEATLAAKAERAAQRLAQARAEIDRLERETSAMRASKYDDVLRQLRDRVNAL